MTEVNKFQTIRGGDNGLEKARVAPEVDPVPPPMGCDVTKNREDKVAWDVFDEQEESGGRVQHGRDTPTRGRTPRKVSSGEKKIFPGDGPKGRPTSSRGFGLPVLDTEGPSSTGPTMEAGPEGDANPPVAMEAE